MYIGLHVKYPFSCQILMELQFSSQVFEKYLKIKFNENPSNGSQAPPCEWMDGQRDMTKLIVTFRKTIRWNKNTQYVGVIGIKFLIEVLEMFITNIFRMDHDLWSVPSTRYLELIRGNLKVHLQKIFPNLLHTSHKKHGNKDNNWLMQIGNTQLSPV